MSVTRRQLAAARAREGIPVSLILEELVKHLRGRRDLTATQIRAAEILLKKAMPDLQSVEMTADMTVRDATELSREELLRIAAGGGAGATEAADGDGEPAAVH
jgi:hypothetical protein